jgi:hypothetical protein
MRIIITSIQLFGPVWQEPEPSQATGMALARCILGKYLVVYRTPLIWRPRRQIREVRWVNFFLFSRLKIIIKGESFADVAEIQERVTAVLRSIPKEAFADSFQKIYERYLQCVVKDGDYFEGQ